MISSIRVIHPPGASSNPTSYPVIILNVNTKNYIFNAPEGTVRSLAQRGALAVGAKGEVDVFVSDVCEGVRGISGLLMTLADMGRGKVRIHGPPTLAHAISTMRFYAKRVDSQMQLQVKECPDVTALGQDSFQVANPLLADGGMTVRGLLSWDQDWTSHPQSRDFPSPNSVSDNCTRSHKRRRSSPMGQQDLSLPNSNVETDTPENVKATNAISAYSSPTSSELASTIQHRVFETAHDMFRASMTSNGLQSKLDDPSAIPKGRPVSAAWNLKRLPTPVIRPFQAESSQMPATQPLVLSYVATLPTTAGKVDLEAAKLLGVRPGPALGQLQRGNAVTIRRPVGWSSMPDADKLQWMQIQTPRTDTRGRKKKAAQVESSQILSAAVVEGMEDVLIEPSACVAPAVPGPVVIIVHLPTVGHLPSFLSTSNTAALLAATKDRNASIIIHTSPLSVLSNEKYRNWLETISKPETSHIFTAPEVAKDKILYPTPALSLLQLSELDAGMFSIPPYSVGARKGLSDLVPQTLHTATALDLDITATLQPRISDPISTMRDLGGPIAPDFDFDPLLRTQRDVARKKELMHIGPSRTVAESLKEEAGVTTARKQLAEMRSAAHREFRAMARAVKEEVDAIEVAEADDQKLVRTEWEGVEVVTLGTGSAQPTKARGVSATLIRLPARFFGNPQTLVSPTDGGPAYGYVLLDAGEGTLGQLHQRYGKDSPELQSVIRNLRLIFISHVHADHCSGLISVLRARYELGEIETPLYLVANSFTRQFLYEWDEVQPLNLLEEGKYGTARAEEIAGKVIMLESEHLDYRFGVGQVSSTTDDEQPTESYLTHLATEHSSAFVHWLKTLRRDLLSLHPFTTMSEAELVLKTDEINKTVWAMASHKDISLTAYPLMPAFVEAALKSDSDDYARPGSPHLQDISFFFRNRTMKAYEQHKENDRSMTRWAFKLLRREFDGPSLEWSVETCPVDHRIRHCYGLILRLGARDARSEDLSEFSTPQATFSLAYSGDTRPTSELATAAFGVNLLIHEATMQDEEAEMAHAKGHSTIGGALQIAKEAQCDVVLLTHFSQRYPKMARLNLTSDGTEDENQNQQLKGRKRKPIVAVGMDLLRLEMNQMWKMGKYLSAMETLFKADAVGGDEEEGGENGVGVQGEEGSGKEGTGIADEIKNDGRVGQGGMNM